LAFARQDSHASFRGAGDEGDDAIHDNVSDSDEENENVQAKDLEASSSRESFLTAHHRSRLEAAELAGDDNALWSHLLLAENRTAARRALGDGLAAARGRLSACKFVGPDVGSSARWSGGTRAPNGKVYFAPRSADFVLCVDPVASSVERFGDSVAAFAIKKPDAKYSDAVATADGRWLFLVPASAPFVLRMVRFERR